MDKEQAKQQVAALTQLIKVGTEEVAVIQEALKGSAARLAELQKIIDAPAVAPSLLTKPKPGSCEDYWQLEAYSAEPLGSARCVAMSEDPIYYRHGNIFQTAKLAEAYADAIETMLLLRHQPGTVPASDEDQWQLEVDDSGPGTLVQVKVARRVDRLYKMNKLSPCFKSREAALSAVAAVGTDRILRMFKTFHHIKD